MPFIRVSSPESNIWEDNPALELISEFKEFKAVEGVKKSSNILKAIFYIWDPKSTLKDSGIPHDKLVEDVTNNLIKLKKFNWNDYEEIRQVYLKYNLSRLETLLLEYEAQIEELNGILRKWKATKEDATEKARLIKLHKELWEDYLQIKMECDDERVKEEEFYAGYNKSKLEKYGSERA